MPGALTTGPFGLAEVARPADVDLLQSMLAGEQAIRCLPGSDIEELLNLAEQQGVIGIVGPWLLANRELPLATQEAIERRIALQRLTQAGLSRRLAEILEELEAGGVAVACLKGPILSERLYGDLTSRQSADLDLLVAPGELQRLSESLLRLGYHSDEGPTARYFRRHHHHLEYCRSNRPVIEVHFRLYSGFGQRPNAEPILQRSLEYHGALGLPVRILAPEDELVFLVVHGVGHAFERLLWLHDLAVFIERHPGLDWQRVASRASSMGLREAVAHGLNRVRSTYCLTIPTRGLTTLHPLRSKLAGWAERLAGKSQESKSTRTVALLVLQALLCDHASTSLAFSAHHGARILRRRMHRWLPAWIPEDWAG